MWMTWLLGPLLGRPHLTKQIHARAFKFCRSLLMSDNVVVKAIIIVRNSLSDARSPIVTYYCTGLPCRFHVLSDRGFVLHEFRRNECNAKPRSLNT